MLRSSAGNSPVQPGKSQAMELHSHEGLRRLLRSLKDWDQALEVFRDFPYATCMERTTHVMSMLWFDVM